MILVEGFCPHVTQTSGGFLILIFLGSSLFGGSNSNGTELFGSVQQSSTVIIQGNMKNGGLKNPGDQNIFSQVLLTNHIAFLLKLVLRI